MSKLPLFERLERDADEPPDDTKVFRVGELNRAVRLRLEDSWGRVWVQGELSDVHRSGAGHLYYSLNDEQAQAQVRGVMFRSDLSRCKVELKDGARVELFGSLSLFEPRGQFQLIARRARAVGEGDLSARFEKTRKTLEKEGLLDHSRKRELPAVPKRIGIVTSEQGAALVDFIQVAANRCPVTIVVADCRVQGDRAADTIVDALNHIQRLDDIDLVVITRGGGSAEDLWAFNEERVARAIAKSAVPTISAIGHEIDVTIADLVADVRASTPSNAAEIAVPDKDALYDNLEELERRLQRHAETLIDRARWQLEQLARALLDPRRKLADDRNHWLRLHMQLKAIAAPMIAQRRAELQALAGRLNALSPLAVLERGYAIAIGAKEGRAIVDSAEVAIGDELRITLHQGELGARVEEVS